MYAVVKDCNCSLISVDAYLILLKCLQSFVKYPITLDAEYENMAFLSTKYPLV